MPHFILGCAPGRPIVEGPAADEAWWKGSSLEDPPADPLVFSLAPAGEGRPASLYDGLVPLWSDRLVNAMRNAGVDNFEAYPAVLDDSRSGREWPTYWAVNVLGLVAATDRERLADEEQSSPEPEQLTVDQQRVAAFRMFRPAEAPDLVLIDARVRESLEREGLTDLEFTLPGSSDE